MERKRDWHCHILVTVAGVQERFRGIRLDVSMCDILAMGFLFVPLSVNLPFHINIYIYIYNMHVTLRINTNVFIVNVSASI